jgi:PQQ-like domain
VIGGRQEVFHRIAGSGRLEVEHRRHLNVAIGALPSRCVAGAVIAVQQLGPQPVGCTDRRFEPVQFPAGAAYQRAWGSAEPSRPDPGGAGPGERVPGQRGGPVGLPRAKARESSECVQGGQPSAKRAVELPAPRGVQFTGARPDVIGDNPGLQRPRHTAAAFRHNAVTEQLRHRQSTPGQEFQRSGLTCLLGATIGQVGLEDRLLADCEDAATSARLWSARYNGPGNSIDNARAAAVSPDGTTVFVTGDSVGGPESGHSEDYATIAYRASDGTQLWVARFNSPANGADFGSAVSVARDGKAVFVTGTSFAGGFDSISSMTTVAYRTSDGAQLWVKSWTPASCCNYGGNAIISPGGNRVFVTGLVQSQAVTAQYGTVAYNAATGARLGATAAGAGHRSQSALT